MDEYERLIVEMAIAFVLGFIVGLIVGLAGVEMTAKRENPAAWWQTLPEVEAVPACLKRTFAEECQALSTGWRWSVEHWCYVRVRLHEPIVEAAAPGSVPRDKELLATSLSPTSVRIVIAVDFVPWWESRVLLNMVERLRQACASNPDKRIPIVGYERWNVDAEGRTVTDGR